MDYDMIGKNALARRRIGQGVSPGFNAAIIYRFEFSIVIGISLPFTKVIKIS